MSTEKPWPGPPAGVSTTDGAGGHKSVAPPPPQRARRPGPGEDVLQNVHELRQVGESTGMNPVGVQAVSRDVRIGKMPKTRRSRRHTVTFQSVDGEEYVFRTHDTKGNELPTNRLFLLFAAVREMILGGNPKNVFDAWNVKLLDVEGKQFYPLPQEVLERMMAEEVLRDELHPEDDDQSEFSLGQAE